MCLHAVSAIGSVPSKALSRRTTRAAIVAVLGLALTGCGASTDSPTETGPSPRSAESSPLPPAEKITADPADGPRFRGRGYVFSTPAGWHDVTDTVDRDESVDLVAARKRMTKGFTESVNVVVVDGARDDAALAAFAGNLERSMRKTAPDYAAVGRVRVAGTPATHLTGERREGGKRYWLDQYVVSQRRHTYVISFSLAPKRGEQRRARIIEPILTSWSWA